jgi:RNA polymerase sigma-70 factor (ECF subfamily)
MTTTSSDPLLADAKQGDPAALGRLLERYQRYLTLLAGLELGPQLRGKVDAADVVQETFLEASRNFHRFQGSNEATLIAWLRQILATSLANVERRYLGTHARDVRLERQIADALDRSSVMLDRALVAQQSTPSQQAAHREQAVLLADALAELPPDYREVIILRHLEGLTFPQAAERMGRSVDSVEKLWLRGVTKLRRAFGEGT